MANQNTFVIGGDPAAARALVEGVVAEFGFAAAGQESTGAIKISRGSMAKTVLLGAMAGKNLHITFYVGYGADSQGNLVVTVSRDTALGAVKGGAIGASKTAEVYQTLVNRIGETATQRGVFLSHAAA